VAGRLDDVARWVRRLFAVERQALALRLAVRGTLGLMVPLLAEQALSRPALNVVAFAAFLLAFGDLTEDRGWLARLAAGSVFGALAVASGVLAGAHPAAAALAMLGWGVLLGLAGVYGDGAAAMALPVAWAFLEIGLTAPDRSVSAAAEYGALFLGGGAWAIALAWAMLLVRRDRPLAERTAACYDALSAYLARPSADSAADPSARGFRPTPETRVRSAIADARRLALETRQRQSAASPLVQRLVVLIELADQIFSHAVADAELRAGRPASSALAEGARAVGRALLGHASPAATTEAASALEQAITTRTTGHAASASPEPAGARTEPARAVLGPDVAAGPADRDVVIPRLLATSIAHAIRVADGDPVASDAPLPAADPSNRPARSRERLLAPLATIFDRRSIVARHALRYGVVTALAVLIDSALAPPFGYWIPLTATVVLKPYAGSTLTRAGQRLTGTIAGVSVGVLLEHTLTDPTARGMASAAAFFATIAVLRLNYALAIFFLSAGIVPFEGLLGARAEWQVGLLRALDTGIGGALALAGGYLLWPSFERRSFPAMLAAALTSTARYADRVLAGPAGDTVSAADVECAYRQAGVDNTNLQASFQRVVAEPGTDAVRLQAALVAVVALQRMLLTLRGLRVLRSAGEPQEWARLRDLARRGLGDLPTDLARRGLGDLPTDLAPVGVPASPAAKGADRVAPEVASGTAPRDPVLALEASRLAWQIETLQGAVGRIGTAGLERETPRASSPLPSERK
jgi:uncharacterized membrane protein YccC